MTDIAKVRLLINDRTTPYNFSDEEIQAFLDMDSDIYLAAALALEAWAAEYTLVENSEKLGDYSYTKKQVENMLALAKQYRSGSGSSSVIDYAGMDLITVPGSEQ